MAPVSWLRGWGARRGNMDGRRMRLYKGAGRPGRTHMGTQNVRFYRDFGPQISMGAENFHGGGTHLWRNPFSLPLARGTAAGNGIIAAKATR